MFQGNLKNNYYIKYKEKNIKGEKYGRTNFIRTNKKI